MLRDVETADHRLSERGWTRAELEVRIEGYEAAIALETNLKRAHRYRQRLDELRWELDTVPGDDEA